MNIAATTSDGRRGGFVGQLAHFAYQEAASCLFPALIFLTLGVSKFVTLPFLHRYDVILLVCVLIQIAMYRTGLETKDEMKVIAVFRVIGLVLELYKTSHGSWAYPESAWTKIAGVPLYSGFLYASVASYLCQAWRRLDVGVEHWPRVLWSISLAVAIYTNFFTHHYLPDLRWPLTALVFVVFFRTRVRYAVRGIRYRMPLALAFGLIGFFIWIAENIATFLGAWQYPNQRDGWDVVHLSKISSWSLLVIISFIVVAQLKHVKAGRQRQD